MAKQRTYVYQIRGNQLSLVEIDHTNTGDGLNYSMGSASDWTGEDSPFGTRGITVDLGTGSSLLTSPIADITDGLEIEYVYSPEYHINDVSDAKTITAYTESSGLLSMTVNPSMSATAGDWLLIKGSDKWNGLHQVNANVSSATTVVFNTKYNGDSVTESSTLYMDIDVLNNENDNINLPRYLSQALVYYVRARIAEDIMELELKEYMMKEFRKMIEKHENAKAGGPRRIMPGIGAIR